MGMTEDPAAEERATSQVEECKTHHGTEEKNNASMTDLKDLEASHKTTHTYSRQTTADSTEGLITGTNESGKKTVTFILLAINIALPTLDVYSDLYLMIEFFLKGHRHYGLMMLVPFLLNYLLTWLAWYNLDKRKQITWVTAAVSCYPQYCAARVIYLLWWGDAKKAVEEKKRLEREVSEIEVFAEAVLSTIVAAYLMEKVLYRGEEQDLIMGNSFISKYLFFVTFSTSFISAALGMAKSLKVGPCRVLAEGGSLGGLATSKFFLLFVTIAVTLGGKVFIFIVVFNHRRELLEINACLSFAFQTSMALYSAFLPGLLTALLSLCHSRDSARNILRHPSLLLLPVFSHFTFSVNSLCWGKRAKKEVKVMFSRRATLVNVMLSFLCFLGYALIIHADNATFYDKNLLLFSNSLPVILGMLLTLLFLFLDLCPCSSSPPIQFCALRYSHPLTEHVVDTESHYH